VTFGLLLAENHAIDYSILLFTLVSAVSVQIATNLFNDLIDFKKGADKETRLGPQRMTAAGLITPKKMLMMALFFVALATLTGLPLVLHGGWPILVIGLISIALSYMYTGGPFPLAYLGLGDLFVILFFGVIAVGGVYYLNTLSWNLNALILGLQMGFLSTVLIAINNLRDVEQDALVHKKTLAVRLGQNFVKYEIMFLIVASFLAQIYWWGQWGWTSALLPLILIPLAFRLCKNIRKEKPSALYNKFLAQSAFLHAGFGVLITIGFWLK
jgi:1,4-dihydroxy-2-naphthoate octaprenyltransferase